MKPASLRSQVSQVVLLAAILAFAYNSFSIKRIPLVRQEVVKVAVSDSELFHGRKSPVTDTGKARPDTPRVKVIAPLHDSALAHEDTAGAFPPVEEKKDFYRIISLSQLNRLLAEGHYLLIDARDTAAYRKGHIKGARNMFGLATDQFFPELAPMARDTLTLIYCNNPDCHLGRMVGDFMHAIGFTNLYLYDDGWDGWEKAGMPIDSSLVGGP
ncbi:MAG TPA: rhodanese-like domain-containing protein [Bacteroidota bacterium]